MSDEVRRYGLDGWDRLEAELEDAVERAVEDACEVAGEGFEVVMSRMVWPMRVHVYRRMDLPSPEVLAKRVSNDFLDQLDEMYGDPDGQRPEVTPAMLESATAFAKAVLAEYTPWAAEPTGDVIEVTMEQAREMLREAKP